MLVVVGDGDVEMVGTNAVVIVVGEYVVTGVVLGDSFNVSVVVVKGRFRMVEYLYFVVVYLVGSRVNNGFGVVVACVASVVGVVVMVVDVVVATVVTGGGGLVGGLVVFVTTVECTSTWNCDVAFVAAASGV